MAKCGTGRWAHFSLVATITILGLVSGLPSQGALAARAGSSHVTDGRAGLLTAHAWPQIYLRHVALPTHTGPQIFLQPSQQLPTSFPGTPPLMSRSRSGQAHPLALASGDFNRDGVRDLLAGYGLPQGGAIALYRGNLDALAPQSQVSFRAIMQGRYPAPFLPHPQILHVGFSPNFIQTADLPGELSSSFVAAARGGHAVYVYRGEGPDKFARPEIIRVSGEITSLATGTLDSSQVSLLVGLARAGHGSSLLVYRSTDHGFSLQRDYALSGLISTILLGSFGDWGQDAALLSGGHVLILRAAQQELRPVSLPFSVTAVALGSFIYDRDPIAQLALLTTDGKVHIAARTEFDPRQYTLAEWKSLRRAERLHHTLPSYVPRRSFPMHGWKIVETVPAVVRFSPSSTPIMLRSRISGRAADDVMLLDRSSREMVVIAHPDLAAGARTFRPATVTVRPYSGSPVATLATRVNVDGRPGLVTLAQGVIAPSVMMPVPDPTFTVNDTGDPAPPTDLTTVCNGVADCSLREAILRANTDTGPDTIMLPAGTYTLALPRVANDFTGRQGTLEITKSVNIIGAGQNSTIVQGGTSLATSVDKVFSFNEDIAAFSAATVSLSDMTIQNGMNRGNVSIEDGWGGAFDFDTGTNGTANLTVTNVTMQNNETTDGEGAGFAVFNTKAGTGSATVTNSIIRGNSAFRTGSASSGNTGDGGGIEMAWPENLVLNNTQVLNNLATQVNGTGHGVGGGIFALGGGNIPTSLTIHGGAISGNQSSGDGGGISSTAGVTVDGGAVLNGNTADGNGGGMWFNSATFNPATLTNTTITNNHATGTGPANSAGVGGGIHIDDNGGSLSITFSRLAGNTSKAGGSNLDNRLFSGNPDVGSIVTATDDWWGSNSPGSTISPSTSQCPASHFQVCFDPYIVLTNTANPSTISTPSATSPSAHATTLTASFLQDNHGTAIPVSNLDVLLGLPVAWSNAHLGTLSSTQTTIQSNGTATATFTAGNTGGAGGAAVTVDAATVTALVTVDQPPAITSTDHTTFTVGHPGNFIVTADGFPTPTFTERGALPSGVTLDGTTGILSGSPTAGTGGTYPIVITATNGVSPDNTQSFTLTVDEAPSITSANSTTFTVGTAGSFTVTTGHAYPTPPSLSESGTLPGGVTFTDNRNGTATLGGTPTIGSGGTYAFTITATNGVSPDATQSFTLTVDEAPSITSADQATFQVGTAGTFTVSTGHSFPTPANLSESGALPHGVTFTDNGNGTATFAGTPTAGTGGAYALTVTGHNGVAPDVTQSFTLMVNEAPSITSADHTTFTVANTGTFSVTAGHAFPATVTLKESGALPSGVNFHDNKDGTATLSGTPAANTGGTYLITFSASNGVSPDATQSFTLTVDQASSITSTDRTTFQVDTSGSFQVTATGVPPATFSETGSLPSGVTFSPAGLLSGTPSAGTGGTYVISITASNGVSPDATQSFTLTVRAPPTVSVSSSDNPSVHGEGVSFTATVSAATGTPSGSIQFSIDGQPFGSPVSLDGSGQATSPSISSLSVETHAITAAYTGDSSFSSSDGSVTQTVNQASTATTLTSSHTPSVFGQSVTFTATITVVPPGSGTPTGTVDFFDGGSLIGSGTVSTSNNVTSATFTTSSLGVDSHSITAVYNGDATFTGSSASADQAVTQSVNQAETSTSLSVDHSPSVSGQSVTFTASVSVSAPGEGTATGTVQFQDNGSDLGSAQALTNGVATLTLSSLSVDKHPITAVYSGDTNVLPSTSSILTQVVNRAETSTSVTSSQNPSTFGQSVMFMATVSPVAPGTGTPTGTVTFYDGSTVLGTETLPPGSSTVTFTTSSVTGGDHTISARYTGDTSFNASTAGTELSITQTVNPADTTTTLASSPNPSVFGQSVTFTATMTTPASAIATPTGTVNFFDGIIPIGTGTVSTSNGVTTASVTTSALAVGPHTITASYSGDGNVAGSSATGAHGVNQQVNQASTTTTVTSSSTPSAPGQSVTFTATVSSKGGSPTGTVQFAIDGTDVGSPVALNNSSQATSPSISTLSVGPHTVTATYSGDSNFAGSNGSLTQTVSQVSTTTTLTSSATPSDSGQAITFTATVSPSSATGTVQFAIDGHPFGSPVPLIGGTATSGSISSLAPGTHTIIATYVSDAVDLGSSDTLTQTVRTSVLTGSLASGFHPVEGQRYSGPVATFTDTNTVIGASQLTATITWGDGSSSAGTVSGSGGSFTVSGSHPYADEGRDRVSVTLQEGTPGQATGTASGTVTVAEGDVLTPTTSTLPPATASHSYTLTATFTDTTTSASPADFHATITWGDGTTSAGTVSGSTGHLTVSGHHTYALTRSYPVSVILADDAPGTARATAKATLRVTAPTSSPHVVVSVLASTPCTSILSNVSTLPTGKVAGKVVAQDERPGGTPCDPTRPAVVTIRSMTISSLVCTSHTTASIYGQAKETTGSGTSTVQFRLDVVLNGSTARIHGTVTMRTSSGYSSGVIPATVQISGC